MASGSCRSPRFFVATSLDRGAPSGLRPGKRWANQGGSLKGLIVTTGPIQGFTIQRGEANASTYARVAFPRYPAHLARDNINRKRAEAADAAFLALPGYGVMSGRQRNPKSPLIIRSERRDFRSLFVLHDEGGIRERFRTGSVRSDWPSLSWTKRNHSLDACSRSGLCLPGRKTCSHDQ